MEAKDRKSCRWGGKPGQSGGAISISTRKRGRHIAACWKREASCHISCFSSPLQQRQGERQARGCVSKATKASLLNCHSAGSHLRFFLGDRECFAYDTVSWKFFVGTFGTHLSQVRLEICLVGLRAMDSLKRWPKGAKVWWNQRLDFLWHKEMRFRISRYFNTLGRVS